MISPEWKKELTEKVAAATSAANTNLTNHANTGKNTADTGGDIHRAIYVSTKSPTASEGKNGDIWVTVEG
jgi:hypothetical protein